MGGQGGWERRSEACVKIKKKMVGGGRGRVGGGKGQGGCEWRSEAFVKIQKKNIFFFWGGGGSDQGVGFFFFFFFFLGGGGVRVDGNGELKLL